MTLKDRAAIVLSIFLIVLDRGIDRISALLGRR
jgi:hypothetical protein